MRARIGVSPLLWANDDMPDLGADITLETALAEARLAGYEGIELGHKFPRTPALLRPLLRRHGLALISGWYGARLLERSVDEELAALRDHLDLLVALGCSVMVFAEVSGSVHAVRNAPLSSRPVLSAREWRWFGGALTEVGEHLLERGIRLAYHHHMGTVVESEEEIGRLMGYAGESVGLLLDTGHLTFARGDAVRVARRYGDRIVHVHLKDVRSDVVEDARRNDWSFLEAVLAGVFTVPGDGCVRYPALFDVLRQRYHDDGWVVVEVDQDPTRVHPLTSARRGYRYVATVLERGLAAA